MMFLDVKKADRPSQLVKDARRRARFVGSQEATQASLPERQAVKYYGLNRWQRHQNRTGLMIAASHINQEATLTRPTQFQ
jgi:hypothetical protein